MINKMITGLMVVLSFFMITVSCSSSSDDSKHEVKADSATVNNNIITKQVMSETTYNVTVDLKKSTFLDSLKDLPLISNLLKSQDASTCSGTSKLILYDDYSQKLEGNITCLGLIKIDLADSMQDNDIERMEEDMSKYPYFGSILRENNPIIKDKRIPEGSGYFQPPRPILINPMVSGDKLAKKMSEDSTMVFINSSKEQVKTNGKFTIEVLDTKAEIPNGVDPSYIKGDIVHIDIQSSGFAGVDNRSKYLLFKSREMFISLNPIIITKMVIHSSIKDLISSDSYKTLTTLASSLVGDITINFVMTKHETK